MSVDPVPLEPAAEYALTLPTFRLNGQGGPASGLNRTAAQSEIVSLDNTRLLVLSRDGNGLGHIDANPSVFKSILLVDIAVGSPTDVAADATRNAEGGTITSAPGVLDASITPLQWREAVNMLNDTQLAKFNLERDLSGLAGAYQVSKLTLGEKWEGLALVPAEDPVHPNDYFLFVGNDDDFLTSNGVIRGPDGLVSYNGFSGYAANRLPAPVKSPNNENDTLILAYRVTIITGSDDPLSDNTGPVIVPDIEGTLVGGQVYSGPVTVSWTVSDAESGILRERNCRPRTLPAAAGVSALRCSAVNGAGISNGVVMRIEIEATAPAKAISMR